jgi:iron(III) transport system permease protein
MTTLLAAAALVIARGALAGLADVSLQPTWIWRLGRGRWAGGAILALTMFLVAGVPIFNLAYKAGAQVSMAESGPERSWSALKTLQRIAAAPREFSSELLLTAELGAAAACAAVILGAPLAWRMRLAGRTPRLTLLALAICLTIPGPLLGIGVIRLLNQPPNSPLSFLAVLYDSYFAPWAVLTIRVLPLVTLILWAGLASIPAAVLDAAAIDGAGWWARLFRIALPQRKAALFAAWLVGFAVACGELAASILVLPPGPTTVSVRVFQLLHYGVDDRAAAISLFLVGAAAAVSAAVMLLRPRRA